jgi:hypothetical protein
VNPTTVAVKRDGEAVATDRINLKIKKRTENRSLFRFQILGRLKINVYAGEAKA